MANHICSYIRCQLWSVSGGVRICCQNFSSMSTSWDIDIQSFADFQGSGWKPVCFLPCTSNIVTALANGAMQAGSLSVFSLPYLALSLPWLMKLGGHTASFRGAQKEARPACQDPPWWLLAGSPGSRQGCWSFRGFQNFKRRYLSAPRRARAFLAADLNTWQGRLQNLNSIRVDMVATRIQYKIII